MFSLLRRWFKKSAQVRANTRRLHCFESLEERRVLSSYAVTNLNDHGLGSLRQAITNANNHLGPDSIRFDVPGVITLTTGALPKIIDTVNIDGKTAPGYTGTPRVEVNFNTYGGLIFRDGSEGSAVRALSLAGSIDAALELDHTGGMLIVGNYIGLHTNGGSSRNSGDGIEIIHSPNNQIGGEDAEDRNVIANNFGNGISLSDTARNTIENNYIGVDPTGQAVRGNRKNGILLTDGSKQNVIGPANVISANQQNGVRIEDGSSNNRVDGNLIGLNSDGDQPLGNALDGVRVVNSNGNVIGDNDEVRSIDFYDSSAGSDIMQPVNGWQGITGGDSDGQYIMTGTTTVEQNGQDTINGLMYIGTIDGNDGSSYLVNYPDPRTSNTSVYGPDNLGGGTVRLVGTYKDSSTPDVAISGFVYDGTPADLSNPANWTTINHPGSKYNYVHSTSGGLAVGNYDNPLAYGNLGIPGPGHAFIYDVDNNTFLPDVVYPGSTMTSAYGIVYNGGTSYTIVGGYSKKWVGTFDDFFKPFGTGYMVDFNSATGQFTHWKSFSYPDGINFLTHFQGVSSVEQGVYTLGAASAQIGLTNPVQGSFVTVRRNTDGSFGDADWTSLNYPNMFQPTTLTSPNSVYGNAIVGIVISLQAPAFTYQAYVNVGFDLSNTISANGGNGISLVNADASQVSMNYIGTDDTGTDGLGNGGNGILITSGSAGNLIGGEATGGNDPTSGVFVVPPLGNLISANGANGVLINSGSHDNQLSGNFIGTAADGNSALGNALDGVAIDSADDNTLLGCLFQENPFVFYNVISGNLGNGLRVNDSDDTTIQANFFGLGADNDTAVGNGGNGVLIEGNSAHTVMGGPVPMGNVTSANAKNGILVRDTASDFLGYNNFAGIAAFTTNDTLGNGQDGIKITSSGGQILLRTNVSSANQDDGIEISGSARDVDVVGNIVGLTWDGFDSMGNADNGVEVGGDAHDILIGGPQVTFNVIPHNAISANGNNGIAIVGTAHDVAVNHSLIGTNIFGDQAFGNLENGVYLGPGTSGNTIGSLDSHLKTLISGNGGDGVTIDGSNQNVIQGALIGTERDGDLPMSNDGNGVHIINGFDNLIAQSVIAYNHDNGVYVQSGKRNGIHQNSIHTNDALGIQLGPGANRDQPAPVLTSAIASTYGVQVTGTITSTPSTTFSIELFANDGNGPEGRVYLGTVLVKTNSKGVGQFTFVGGPLPSGVQFITATATDPNNNTSKFSNSILIINNPDFIPGIYLYYPGR